MTYIHYREFRGQIIGQECRYGVSGVVVRWDGTNVITWTPAAYLKENSALYWFSNI